MKYLIYLFFIFLSLGQLQRISFFDQSVNVYFHDLVIFTMVIFSLIHTARKKPLHKTVSQFISDRILKTFALFLLVLSGSFLWRIWEYSLYDNMVGFMYIARLFLYLAFFISLSGVAAATLKKGILLFSLLTIIFSVLQYFFYPNLRNLYYLGWDPHHYRLFGTFFDTAIMGIILVIIFFLSGRMIKAVVFILLLLTYSRLAYVSFIAAAVFQFFNKKDYQKIIVLLVLFIVLLPLLPRSIGVGVKLERIFSIESRIADQKQGVAVFLKYPILGLGYNRIHTVKAIGSSQFPSHAQSAFSSSYITILAASGLAGLTAMIFFLKAIFENTDQWGKTVIVVLTVASLFDNIFLSSAPFLLLLVAAKVDAVSTSRKIR